MRFVKPQIQGRKLEGVWGCYTPRTQILPEVGPKIIVELQKVSDQAVINFLLKHDKFAKILAEINAQIMGNGLCRVQDFKNFRGRIPSDSPIKHHFGSRSQNGGHPSICTPV